MSEDQSNGSVSASIMGNSFSINGIKSIGGLLLVLSLLVEVGIGVLLFVHYADAKDNLAAQKARDEKQQESYRKIEDAMKTQTQQIKMQTCVQWSALTEDQKQRTGLRYSDVCR